MSVDLGASGTNTLKLGNFSNTGTVNNVDTLIGGTGADVVTLGNAASPTASVDLGGGADKLTLAAAGRRIDSRQRPDAASAAAAPIPSRWPPR